MIFWAKSNMEKKRTQGVAYLGKEFVDLVVRHNASDNPKSYGSSAVSYTHLTLPTTPYE